MPPSIASQSMVTFTPHLPDRSEIIDSSSSYDDLATNQRTVVAVAAGLAGPVAMGSVVDGPSSAALLLLKEHLVPFTTFRAHSAQSAKCRRFVVQTKIGEGLSSVVFQVEDYVEDR
eukprot:EG_transcript_56405